MVAVGCGGAERGGWTLFLCQNDLIPMQSGSSTMTHLQSWPDATGAVRVHGVSTWTHYHVASVGRQSPLTMSVGKAPADCLPRVPLRKDLLSINSIILRENYTKL